MSSGTDARTNSLFQLTQHDQTLNPHTAARSANDLTAFQWRLD